MSFLKRIALQNNSFHGPIPQEISQLFRLRNIVLSNNSFQGKIPINISRCSNLEILNLIDNRLTGNIPVELGSLSKLRGLSLGGNKLSGTSLLPLAIFHLFPNFLYMTVVCMERFPMKLPSFSAIGIEDNQIHGSIPSVIGNLLNLNALVLAVNYLSGPIPTTIGKLYNLQLLHLYQNNFTQLPSSLGNLTLLNYLYLGHNNIYGSIPPTLSNCSSLLELNITHNNLHGSIPPEILSLSSISIAFSLSYNALTGSLPSEVGSLKNLEVLDISNNKLSGPLPSSLGNCLSLEQLHLEVNSFEGKIPQSLRELRGLQELDLSHNNLSGLIPSFLGDLKLEKLNLSFNRLHGEVPMGGVFQNGSAISVVGNIDLCGGSPDLNLPLCPSSKSNKNKLSHKIKAILAVVATLVLCLILKKANSVPSLENQMLRVSYADLLKTTDGFSEDNLIGVGSYSSVYKGILNQVQTMVAVKLKGASKSFMSECKALRTIHHRNLLKILSACSSIDFQGNEFKALVYEFMVNGSLEKWLHHDVVENEGHEEESKNLKLIQRLNIAMDVASAVEYLHCHCESTIIHGDLKPSNVLLDDEMTAFVGDFGLTKILSAVSSEVAQHESNSIAVRGTIGYVAPEYAMGNRASTLADVYSYGILLMVMFTGKNPTDNVFNDGLSLHSFVGSALPDKVMEIVDPRILSEHVPGSWLKDILVSAFKIGVACSMESPRDQMQIEDVVNELCKIKNVCES
ncbi:hypothetical protein ACSBR2_030957 [Camellia fascicularis]